MACHRAAFGGPHCDSVSSCRRHKKGCMATNCPMWRPHSQPCMARPSIHQPPRAHRMVHHQTWGSGSRLGDARARRGHSWCCTHAKHPKVTLDSRQGTGVRCTIPSPSWHRTMHRRGRWSILLNVGVYVCQGRTGVSGLRACSVSMTPRVSLRNPRGNFVCYTTASAAVHRTPDHP